MYLIGNEGFDDFSLLDSGDGNRLERWGAYTLVRPDPQTIWQRTDPNAWENADAVFEREQWTMRKELPEYWDMKFHEMSFLKRCCSVLVLAAVPQASSYFPGAGGSLAVDGEFATWVG